MKNLLKYNCKVCKENEAVLCKIFITSNLQFRAKFLCKKCLNKFEITIDKNEWHKLNYSYEEVAKKIRHKLERLEIKAEEIFKKAD